MARPRLYKRTFMAANRIGRDVLVKGVALSENPASPVIHRALMGDVGWTVSEPRSGVSLMIGLPTRTKAVQFCEAFRAFLNRWAPKGRKAA